MFPKLDPCTRFQEVFTPHKAECNRCQKAVEAIEQVEWKGQFHNFCPSGLELINSHLTECDACAASTSLYLQNLAEALSISSGKPIQ